MKSRSRTAQVIQDASSKRGRLIVLTGARQTGKTTLVRRAFPDFAYVSLDDPASRPAFTRFSARDWIARFPRAIIDEVQKSPSIIEAIKAAHDADASVRYILTGSSQILLLSQVKESLAGRAIIRELWPLTLPEIATGSWDSPIAASRLVAWLRADPSDTAPLVGIPATDRRYAEHAVRFDRYLHFGAMPVVHDDDLSDAEREEWLANYQRTYLERDVADLATQRDLEPFVVAQRVVAARTSRLVNVSEMARAVGVRASTAQRFLRYLDLSYQVVFLNPYFRNAEKRLTKMQKVHFLDPGVLRSVVRRRGTPTGEEFESAVFAEIYKQIRNENLPIEFRHVRTHDGRDVDLLLELEAGFVAIEIKMAERVGDQDARHLRGLETLLDKPLLARLVVSMDQDARSLESGAIAVPAAWLLAPTE